jgi:miniconductance mechanosensitive channel
MEVIVKIFLLIKGLAFNTVFLVQEPGDATPESIELTYLDHLRTWLVSHNVSENYADMVKLFIVFGTIILLALLADWVARRIFLAIVAKVAAKTNTVLDDMLVENKVFHRLANLAPAAVVYYAIKVPLAGFPEIMGFVHKTCELYIVVMSLMVVLAFLRALNDMYNTLEVSKTRPIKGYIQITKIILYVVVTLVLISVLWDLDLGKLFVGLGTMTAVLMFIFKDVILGLIASIQLSANDILRPGDWIEMPSRKADGIVKDISLTTVKVQNFDNTVTTIPTYSLVSDSFTNWRGMQESEGRRIKKSIFIDMKSIQFYNDQMLANLKANPIVSKSFDMTDYLENDSNFVSGLDKEHRTLTNLGLFRAYLEAYLRSLPSIHPEMTLMVRYLQPTENGLPVEIVAFSKEKSGNLYEKLQSELYDHILATLPVFNLKVFQRPTSFTSNE